MANRMTVNDVLSAAGLPVRPLRAASHDRAYRTTRASWPAAASASSTR
jgi:hypothetical protein